MDVVERRGDRVVVAVSWVDRRGRRHAWAHVLELRDGAIVRVQDYGSPAAAAAAARLRGLFA